MIAVLLSFNVILPLVPVIVIAVLILAAAGLTRGSDVFALLGIGALIGLGGGRSAHGSHGLGKVKYAGNAVSRGRAAGKASGLFKPKGLTKAGRKAKSAAKSAAISGTLKKGAGGKVATGAMRRYIDSQQSKGMKFAVAGGSLAAVTRGAAGRRNLAGQIVRPTFSERRTAKKAVKAEQKQADAQKLTKPERKVAWNNRAIEMAQERARTSGLTKREYRLRNSALSKASAEEATVYKDLMKQIRKGVAAGTTSKGEYSQFMRDIKKEGSDARKNGLGATSRQSQKENMIQKELKASDAEVRRKRQSYFYNEDGTAKTRKEYTEGLKKARQQARDDGTGFGARFRAGFGVYSQGVFERSVWGKRKLRKDREQRENEIRERHEPEPLRASSNLAKAEEAKKEESAQKWRRYGQRKSSGQQSQAEQPQPKPPNKKGKQKKYRPEWKPEWKQSNQEDKK
jgi:hypothetical protein